MIGDWGTKASMASAATAMTPVFFMGAPINEIRGRDRGGGTIRASRQSCRAAEELVKTISGIFKALGRAYQAAIAKEQNRLYLFFQHAQTAKRDVVARAGRAPLPGRRHGRRLWLHDP